MKHQTKKEDDIIEVGMVIEANTTACIRAIKTQNSWQFHINQSDTFSLNGVMLFEELLEEVIRKATSSAGNWECTVLQESGYCD